MVFGFLKKNKQKNADSDNKQTNADSKENDNYEKNFNEFVSYWESLLTVEDKLDAVPVKALNVSYNGIYVEENQETVFKKVGDEYKSTEKSIHSNALALYLAWTRSSEEKFSDFFNDFVFSQNMFGADWEKLLADCHAILHVIEKNKPIILFS